MKVYISGNLDFDVSFDSCSYQESSQVLILPGGVDTLYDLFLAIKDKKEIFLYNKDFFYTPIINMLYSLYTDGIEDDVPSSYIDIESELETIIMKLEGN